MTQKEALEILKTGRNVFLTGAAGSGKTYVLRQYIEYLQDLGAQIGITASTGIAATHMGGITIHSWSGIGIRDSLNKDEASEIAEKSHIKNKIKKASVLIVDEISMLHPHQLDMVDRVVRRVKENEEPFGGLQIVFCGDFFQLPPVKKTFGSESLFAYHSDSWQNLGLKICYLTEQHRQNDLDYLEILNAIRENNISNKHRTILESRLNQTAPADLTRLYSHNRDVDGENEIELNKIKSKLFEYEMETRGQKILVEILKKGCLAPEKLRLKIGAKVMFVKNNFELGYVNGTLGTVIDCDHFDIKVRTLTDKVIEVPKETWHIEEEGKIKAELKQYPLRLAWAITVHKSQGISLDQAQIDLQKAFEKGMGYVALSRIRTLDGLFLNGLNEKALEVNEDVLKLDQKFRELSKTNSFHINTMAKEKIDKMQSEFKTKVSVVAPKAKKLDTVSETKLLLDQGLDIKKIAKTRGLKVGTILDHIETIKTEYPSYNIRNLQNLISRNKFNQIYSAFRKIGMNEGGIYNLAPVKNLLGPKYSYEDLRLVRLFL